MIKNPLQKNYHGYCLYLAVRRLSIPLPKNLVQQGISENSICGCSFSWIWNQPALLQSEAVRCLPSHSAHMEQHSKFQEEKETLPTKKLGSGGDTDSHRLFTCNCQTPRDQKTGARV